MRCAQLVRSLNPHAAHLLGSGAGAARARAHQVTAATTVTDSLLTAAGSLDPARPSTACEQTACALSDPPVRLDLVRAGKERTRHQLRDRIASVLARWAREPNVGDRPKACSHDRGSGLGTR